MQGVVVPKHVYIRYEEFTHSCQKLLQYINDAAFNNMTNIKNRVIIIYSVNPQNNMMIIIVVVIVSNHHNQFVTLTTVRRRRCIVCFVH